MTEPRGDVDVAVDFLRHWRAEGPWVLTAISPDQHSIGSWTFSPETEAELRAWLAARTGRDNVYFTVNPLLRPMDGAGAKAKKTDVRGMAWLHVDVDPRPNEPLGQERERALRVIRAYSPPPTVIVDSGGGYQGFWRLAEEQPVNGDEARATELEAYNLQVELTLTAASQCYNIDRIMRLPGTVNLPNEKKRRKGRVAAPALVVEAHWDRAYPLSAFTAAPRVQGRGGSGTTTGPRVSISGNLPRLASLDDLPDTVTQRTKMLIVQGDDPDEPTRYPSRSEACFAVCCEMVRAGCSDDQIAAVLLDKDYGVSGHVLAQSRPQDYAARQIRRAREEAIHPRLRELNERHAVVEDLGGKCRVIEEVYDHALRRTRLSKQTFDDFRNRYMHILVEMGRNAENEVIRVQLGKFWLGNQNRRQYRTIVFAPGREAPDSYNLWRGFACEARAGECGLFLSHVRENICGGNDDYYEYLLSWMARCVQRPDSPGEIAVVLRGRMGVGKGKLVKTFGSLWGRHFMPVSDPRHLTGNFNAHLRDCVVLFGDEAFFAGDRRHESILKTLVTEETINIEAKGIDVEVFPNYVHMLLASNSDWVVPAGADDRRYFVLDVMDAKAQDTGYFAAIDAELDGGGREALLHALMTRDLKDFEVRRVPKTAALQDQKLLSLSPTEEWWFERLTDGRLGRSDGWPDAVMKDDVQGDLNRYLERQKIMRRPSPTALGKFLGKVMEDGCPRSYQQLAEVSEDDGYGGQRVRRVRAYFYEVSSLATCRRRWDERYGGPYRWLEVEDDRPRQERAPF